MKHIIIFLILIIVVFLFMIYKLFEGIFNFFLYIGGVEERANKTLNIFQLQRTLLKKMKKF
jgi:uncharacterized protein YxeA